MNDTDLMSQVPREELLEAGRKKLKDYQQRRRSMNTTPSLSASTSLASKRMSASSLRWRSSKPLAIRSDNPGMLIPANSTVASPTSLNEEGYPSPPEIMKRPPPIPVPTVSTPLPPRQSRHERTKSSLIDYTAQFPNTMAYANSSRISVQSTTQNLDEALIWIQQNNRLLKENQRLKEELAAVRQEKDQLEETLRDKEKELQTLRPDVQPRKALEEERYGRSEAKSKRSSFSSYKKDGFLNSRLL